MQPPPPISVKDLLCKNVIAVDIETIANPEVLSMPGVMPEFKAAGNVKDPIKIAAQIKEKEAKFIDKAALDPNYGRIVVLALYNSTVEHVFTGEEKDILTQAWDVLKDWQEICGYNSKSFDVPYILRRSWMLGVKPLAKYDLFPFRTVNHHDLRLILSHGNKTASGKLSTYAKLKLGVDMGASGSEVQAMWEAGKIQDIANHCLEDVKVTWALFKSLLGFYI